MNLGPGSLGLGKNGNGSVTPTEMIRREFEARAQQHMRDTEARDLQQAREADARDLRQTERIEGLARTLTARLDAMDKATELLSANVTRVPTDTDKQISHLQSLHNEKFDSVAEALKAVDLGVQRQFAERDTRSEQSTLQQQKAIDAALMAAEKAVGKQQDANTTAINKSELGTAEQMKQLGVTMQTASSFTAEQIKQLGASIQTAANVTALQIAAVKDLISSATTRIERIESTAIAQATSESKQVSSVTTAHGSTSIVIAIVVAAVGVLTFLLSHVSSSVVK
jgi:hypothetical protein